MLRAANLLLRTVVASAVAVATAAAQADMAPVNSLPNPYRTIEGWAKMPEGRTWGSTSAVAIDRDGQSVWVAERCGANSCVGSALDPVLKFDPNGNLVAHFGAGMIDSPHGIFVDRDKNVWVVDCSCTGGGGRGRGRGGAAPPPPAAGPPKGHQVFKFSPDGKLLMTLGKPGGARDPDYFWQPNAVYVAPNGDIFVAEGHSSNAQASAKVYRFSKDGKLITSWGTWGKGADDFDQPHALAMDSRGRLFVGDRGNNRIKIFDQDGKLLDTWYQFSRPSGIFIDPQDNMYVADSESGSVAKQRTDWKRGIRIGSAKDGSVKYFIPDPAETATNTSAAEGVAVDAAGHIYGAEVGPR
ncbi:MAG: peptidyl-alpha-hydroxyglycine alpha-amidating lyase family protein, partial [Gemmatimonadaceae bacterium]